MTTQTVIVADGGSGCDHDGMTPIGGYWCPLCGRMTTDRGRELVVGATSCPHPELIPATLHECTKPVTFDPPPTDDDPKPKRVYSQCGRVAWTVKVPDESE